MTDEGRPETITQVKDEVVSFFDLKIATTVEYLPVIWVAPVVVQAIDEAVVEADPDPVWDDYVPEDVKQRLIYSWLRFGPSWAPDIVVQAQPVVDDGSVVMVDPARFPRPRVIGHYDDGVTRAIRPKER